MENEQLVSVIVPVYNVEKYLEKCLESIINQTYKNLEIICIDDGSPDNSIDILNRFAEKDNRIKVIRQENKGLSGARNTGIKNSKGKYITFVDSDDWIENNMITLLVKKMQGEDLDLVICGRNHIINGEVKPVNLNKIEKILSGRILNGKEYFLEVVSKTNLFSASAYNKLYLLEKIKKEKLIFPEGRLHEDLLFVFKYLYFSDRVNIINKELYNYVINRKGAITSTPNFRDANDTIFTLRELEKFLESKKENTFLKQIEYINYIYNWVNSACLLRHLGNKNISNYKIKETIRILKKDEIYLKYSKEILKKSRKIKNKILSLLILKENIIILVITFRTGKFIKKIKENLK